MSIQARKGLLINDKYKDIKSIFGQGFPKLSTSFHLQRDNMEFRGLSKNCAIRNKNTHEDKSSDWDAG